MTQNIYITEEENFLELSNDPSLKFKKRSGTTDIGKDYEDLYIAHLILKLLIDDTTTDFQISSNHEDFGAFDDVVLEIQDQQGHKRMYAVQLKHALNAKTLSKKALTETSGNFSIQKYHKELQKESVKIPEIPIQFVILTNQRCVLSDKETVSLIGESGEVEILKTRPESLINTSDKGNAYQFKSNPTGSKYDDMFDRFILYTDQINVHTIKSNLKRDFMEMFSSSEDVFEKYQKFLMDWSISEGLKPKLTKKMMSQTITMLVLSPLLTPLTFPEDGRVTEKGEILREAIARFRVTACHTDAVENLKKLYLDGKSKIPEDFAILKKSASKFQIIRPSVRSTKELNDEEITRLLWLMGKCPLVIPNHQCTRRVLELCPNMKFVVLDDNLEVDGFTKLSHLKPFPSVFNKIVSNFHFSLQGKTGLPLENLIGINQKILDFVTTNELLEMARDPLIVGGKTEGLPPCHVKRRLSRNVIDCQNLLRIETGALFISEFTPRSEFNTYNLIKVDDGFFDRNHLVQKGNIYVVDGKASWLLFQMFCDSIGGSNCHHFRQIGDQFEWLSSKNILLEDRNRLQDGDPVDEDDLNSYEFSRSLNIICADPGMGKTTLMQSLKNHISSEFWTVLIYARSHSRHFRTHKNDLKEFQNYVLSEVRRHCSEFGGKIFEVMMEENLVRYIWDGLDEVSSVNIKSVLGIIGSLREKGIHQWVTSRNNLKDQLEGLFRIPSVTLKEFDDQEQKNYIQQRLECSQDEMMTIFDKVKSSIQLFPYNDILGIPLQIYIITELFKKNMKKYLVIFDEIFTIADLYDHFVDEKFQVYNLDKEEADDGNDLVFERIQQEKTSRVYQYEKAAVKVYLPQDLVTQWRIKCRKFLEELQNGKDRFGIIVDVDEEDQVEFVHNSFGEFFTAQYLSKHLELVPETSTFFFDDKYNNIRFFFDLKLVETKAHIAVLYRNPQLLQKCEDEEILARDKGGRNSLQLLSSWGVRCPPLDLEEKDDGYVLDKTDFDATKFSQGGTGNYQTILSQLTKSCRFEDTDDLFQMTCFRYASKTSSLLSLAMLTCHSNVLSEDFNTNKILVFFYSTLADYDPIFKVMEIPYIKGLEYTLADTESVKCLRKILPDENYKRNRSQQSADGLLFNASKKGNPEVVQVLLENGSNVDGKSATLEIFKPLVIAAGSGNYKVVKLLLDHGADVNVKNNYGTSAIHSAAQSQHYDIVKLLIEHKPEINQPDQTMGTPLHYVLANGNYEIAKLLCENGADVNQRQPHLQTLSPDLRLKMLRNRFPKLAELLVQYNYDCQPSLQERVLKLKQKIHMVRHMLREVQRSVNTSD